MRSSYKRIGHYIRLVDERNRDLKVDTLLGLTIDKEFIPSVANIVGSDMANYKIIRKGQFACSLMQVRRDKKIPVALLRAFDEAIISQAYPVFEIADTKQLLPEYLMMWMSRSEFDREACFYAVGGVRGSLEWEDFCDMELPIPSIEKQREIVKEYHTIVDRIRLNEQLNQKLEETAQGIYKHWFVDFEFPISSEYAVANGKPELEGKPYKSSGGEMVYNDELDQEIPQGWGACHLEDIAVMKYGKMLDTALMKEKGYPVYSGYGIRGFYKKYMYEEPQVLVIARGVSGTGEVKLSPAKSYITNLSIVVEIESNMPDKYFLYYYLKSKNLRSLDSGSAQSQITIGDLNKVTILTPLEKLQKIFGQIASRLAANGTNILLENTFMSNFQNVLLSRVSLFREPSNEIH